MDRGLSVGYRSSADWLADVRLTLAERISARLGDQATGVAEALLGCLPETRARDLAHGLAMPDGKDPINDPDTVSHLPVGRLMAAYALPRELLPWLALLTLAEVDPRLPPLLGYLNNDAARRVVTPAVATELSGPLDLLRHVGSGSALVRCALAELSGHAGQPLPDQALRLAAPIAAWLASDEPGPPDDPALDGLRLELPPLPPEVLLPADIRAALDHAKKAPVLVLVGAHGSGQAVSAAGAGPSLVVSGPALAAGTAPERCLRIALREAHLSGRRLVVTEADRLAIACLRAALATVHGPVALTATERLDLPAPQIRLPKPDRAAAERIWTAGLGATPVAARLAARFRLPPGDILEIAAAGGDEAFLVAACQDRSSRALDALAQPVETRLDWNDLVLPERARGLLRTIAERVLDAAAVYDGWGFGAKLAPSQGLVALFSGPSGTGKTVSAGVLARAIGLPLYRVDLSTTVSKYIGETEKNLDAIFRAAEAGNAILLFDECDALFAKRSEVSDAHDRYANLETSYLLQRLETHRGVVILASNYPQNIDEAFARRIDIGIEFPMPDATMRSALWRGLMPPEAEAAIDADALGARFEISGGAIRNCLLGAAFAAAREGGMIETRHCVAAVAEEYRKTGRPLTRAEFGEAFVAFRGM